MNGTAAVPWGHRVRYVMGGGFDPGVRDA